MTQADRISPVDILPVRAEHVAGFHAVFSAIIAERRFLTHLEPPPLEKTDAFITRALEKDWIFLIALADEKVVGWCDIIPKSQPMFAHCGVLGMGLLASVRGKGIGTQLLKAALGEADGKGLTRIELTVFTDNAPAIDLYEKSGFVIEGELRNDALVDGVYRNATIMARIKSG